MIRRGHAAAATIATGLAGVVALATGAGAASAGAQVASSGLSQSASASSAATHKVIVLLRDQPAMVAATSSAFATRRSRIAAAQAPVLAQLRAGSTHVRAYSLVNAVSATVSAAEEARLLADPAVASVIPDEVIKAPANPAETPVDPPLTRAAPAGTCPTGTTPLLEPEALGVTHTQSDDPTAKTARSLGYTGAGVKVAYMAEGIDINNPDFIRADGSHVFTDYQDFSGDGTAAPTDGAEAFLDASAIAAQGLHSYDIQNFSAVPLQRSCKIRVEGIAPGASLIGLKVFGETSATTTGFLEAIDYAVTVDKVDVLNQSFGGNPFPDSAADAIRLFDEAAVRAGVTVTVSSGDAGPTNTIGSPATDPSVISVGASTTYRFHAQTGYGGYYPLAHDGWLDDNISPLSSSGLSQAGRTIDLLAPGDLDFALCTPNLDLYEGCSNFAGQASPVEESGGTSESAPLTAGAAALVIQAYRQAHGGASPTPAQVKQVLTSTADDLGHPAAEQGSGRLNTYQAVLAAASLHDASGDPARTGSSVLTSATQLDAVALPGSPASWPLTLTNNGATAQTLTLSQRTLGTPRDDLTGSVTLSESSSHFTDFAGDQTNYEVAHFSVPANRDRLDVDLVYPADPTASLNARVRLALIDPKGRFAAHSLPQGVGNAGHVDVHYPASGTWTAMIWSRSSALGGTLGTVKYRVATHDYRPAGSVWPATLTLAPGASRTVKVTATTPGRPGDQSNSLAIASSSGQHTSVPIALRSLIDVAHGGSYSGLLTGGNGRDANTGQTGYLQFDVPAGQRDLAADFTLSGGVTDPAYGYLIDPAGNAQAFSANAEVTGFDSDGNALTSPLSSLSMYARAPRAGRWTLILNFAPAVSGTRLAVPYSGRIGLNTVRAAAAGLPNSPGVTLKAGQAVTVPVTVRNTGVAPASFFVDARTNRLAPVTLAQLAPSPFTLPLAAAGPQWNVPTETTKLQVGVAATVPVNFDFAWLYGYGDPDVAGTSHGATSSGIYTASGSYSAGPVPSGPWAATPAEIGPFGAAGAPAATAVAAMRATTLGFDPAVSTPIGDFELGSVDPSAEYSIVTVLPGRSLSIPVTITPTGAKGTVVSGHLFVDDLALVSVAGLTPAGQELASLPYSYTIG